MTPAAPWHHNQDTYALAMSASARQTREAMDKRDLCDRVCFPQGMSKRPPLAVLVDQALATIGTRVFTVRDVLDAAGTENATRVRDILGEMCRAGRMRIVSRPATQRLPTRYQIVPCAP